MSHYTVCDVCPHTALHCQCNHALLEGMVYTSTHCSDVAELQCLYSVQLHTLSITLLIQQDNQTALLQASNKGHDEVVRVLLAAKATVNTQIKVSFVVQTLSSQHAVIIVSHYVQWGETPLWAASFEGHQKCVELLIDAGANVDIQKEVSVSSSVAYTFKRTIILHFLVRGFSEVTSCSTEFACVGKFVAWTVCLYTCR